MILSTAINARPGISFLSSVPQYLNTSAYASGLNTTYTHFCVATQNSGSLGGWIFSTGASNCFSDAARGFDGFGTSCNIGFAGSITTPATGPYLMTVKQSTTTSRTTYSAGVTPGAAGTLNFTPSSTGSQRYFKVHQVQPEISDKFFPIYLCLRQLHNYPEAENVLTMLIPGHQK